MHRKMMLDRIPNVGDWAYFIKESIEIKDLTYLTAKTGDELPTGNYGENIWISI